MSDPSQHKQPESQQPEPPGAREPQDHVEVSKTEARAGRDVPMVWHVLIISTLAAFLILAVLYLLVPWPTEEPVPEVAPDGAPELVEPAPEEGVVEPEPAPAPPAAPPPPQ